MAPRTKGEQRDRAPSTHSMTLRSHTKGRRSTIGVSKSRRSSVNKVNTRKATGTAKKRADVKKPSGAKPSHSAPARKKKQTQNSPPSENNLPTQGVNHGEEQAPEEPQPRESDNPREEQQPHQSELPTSSKSSNPPENNQSEAPEERPEPVNFDPFRLAAKMIKERADELYRQRNYELASFNYTKLINYYPNNEIYVCNRAACYLMMGQVDRAMFDAHRAVRLNPSYRQGLYRLLKCALCLGDFAIIQFCKSSIMKLNPNDETWTLLRMKADTVEESQVLMNEALLSMDYDKALTEIDRTLEICTHATALKLQKAEILIHLGELYAAETIANGILQTDRYNVDAKFVIGLCAYYSGGIQRSMDCFRDVLGLDPDYQRALNFYKKTKEILHKFAELNRATWDRNHWDVRRINEEILQIDPHNKELAFSCHYSMAQASYYLNDLHRAVEECTVALKHQPNCDRAVALRGEVYIKLQDYDEAIADFSTAISLNPLNVAYHEQHRDAEWLEKRFRKSPYEILNVPSSATAEDVRKAYKVKALKHHPDKHVLSPVEQKQKHERIFKKVDSAFKTLTRR